MYFSFSKREFNGLLILVTLVAFISLLPYLLEDRWRVAEQSAGDRKAIQELTMMMAEEQSDWRNNKAGADRTKRPILFKFDPNLISAAQWQQLGLSPKQAAAIVNYRSKGGKFYKPEDLKKMYTISAALYEELLPYVVIAGSRDSTYINKLPARIKKTVAVLIALNTADTLELDKIKGIGPAFARRIVSYRDRLGGFYKKEQLLEVFGLDSLKFQEIKDQVYVDEAKVVKVNLNTAVYETLKNHPYLRSKQINAILQYRKQHGNYSNIADLKKVAILSATDVERLEPYFSF
ncbi:helix-hairpin-helix domain-containing protein [Pedobacter sp. MR2016-24]|nr:helix-hairpin-helix domain-containing protein [Pedobacter sp. MR2016-24]